MAILWCFFSQKGKTVKDMGYPSKGTSLQRRLGVARVVEGFHSFTCTPTRLSTNGMNHTRGQNVSDLTQSCWLCMQSGAGQWLSMDSEIIMKNGEPIGTQGPTGHYVLLDAHFELPSGILQL